MEDFDFDDGLEDDPEFDDCGLLPDGTCMQAGTEFCDFECILRQEHS